MTGEQPLLVVDDDPSILATVAEILSSEDYLVETARAERVDAVLVAGDIYDRAIPSLDAVALYDDVLIRLREAGTRVILISGNHDSASRLGVNSALIDASGVHLRTRPERLAAPVQLADEHGEVAVYGIPYLEPALGEPALDARSHASVLTAALGGTHLDDFVVAGGAGGVVQGGGHAAAATAGPLGREGG